MIGEHAQHVARQGGVNLNAREIMLIVETTSGSTFRGTPKQIVSKMRRAQWTTPERKGQYMHEVAARVRDVSGATIAVDSSERFLYSLRDAGLVTIRVNDE